MCERQGHAEFVVAGVGLVGAGAAAASASGVDVVAATAPAAAVRARVLSAPIANTPCR